MPAVKKLQTLLPATLANCWALMFSIINIVSAFFLFLCWGDSLSRAEKWGFLLSMTSQQCCQISQVLQKRPRSLLSKKKNKFHFVVLSFLPSTYLESKRTNLVPFWPSIWQHCFKAAAAAQKKRTLNGIHQLINISYTVNMCISYTVVDRKSRFAKLQFSHENFVPLP